jgi:hypothetical protein
MNKPPTKRPLGAFDREIKSDFALWKQAVESHFDYYCPEFIQEEDKIC